MAIFSSLWLLAAYSTIIIASPVPRHYRRQDVARFENVTSVVLSTQQVSSDISSTSKSTTAPTLLPSSTLEALTSLLPRTTLSSVLVNPETADIIITPIQRTVITRTLPAVTFQLPNGQFFGDMSGQLLVSTLFITQAPVTNLPEPSSTAEPSTTLIKEVSSTAPVAVPTSTAKPSRTLGDEVSSTVPVPSIGQTEGPSTVTSKIPEVSSSTRDVLSTTKQSASAPLFTFVPRTTTLSLAQSSAPEPTANVSSVVLLSSKLAPTSTGLTTAPANASQAPSAPSTVPIPTTFLRPTYSLPPFSFFRPISSTNIAAPSSTLTAKASEASNTVRPIVSSAPTTTVRVVLVTSTEYITVPPSSLTSILPPASIPVTSTAQAEQPLPSSSLVDGKPLPATSLALPPVVIAPSSTTLLPGPISTNPSIAPPAPPASTDQIPPPPPPATGTAPNPEPNPTSTTQGPLIITPIPVSQIFTLTVTETQKETETVTVTATVTA